MAVVHGTADALRSQSRRRTLARVCDTFVPRIERAEDAHGFWARAASDLGVPDAIEDALAQTPEAAQEGMRGLLDALADDGFDDSAQGERERMLHELSDSSPEALAAVHALKGLTTMLFYGGPDPETGRNPNWDAVGYP